MKLISDRYIEPVYSRYSALMKSFDKPFIVFAFDEVQILLDQYPNMFIQRAEYLDSKPVETSPHYSSTLSSSRALFHGFYVSFHACARIYYQKSRLVSFLWALIFYFEIGSTNCVPISRAKMQYAEVRGHFC
jgi:hypothetical protein